MKCVACDGTSFPAEYWTHPILRGNDVIGAVVTFLDVTSDGRRGGNPEGVRRREQFLRCLAELRNPLAAILSAVRVLDNAMERRLVPPAAGGRQAGHHMAPARRPSGYGRITGAGLFSVMRSRPPRHGPFCNRGAGPFMDERGRGSRSTSTTSRFGVGDPARLQQVQANLLSNASKYSPEGEGALRGTPAGRPGVYPRI